MTLLLSLALVPFYNISKAQIIVPETQSQYNSGMREGSGNRINEEYI